MNIFEAFHGYELYLVGGSVRDGLMGAPVHDLDYCTNALPDTTFNILSQLGKPYYLGEKFGTIALGDIEVTTYRAETYKNGRKPEVTFGIDLNEDLSRRDFTINAIAQDAHGNLIDPFNGCSDIKAKILKTVGNPDIRFKEDPLRLLRAVRLAGKLGFTIESNTYKSMVKNNRLLLSLSKERIQEELCKILVSCSTSGLTMIRELGFIAFIAPELVMLTDTRSQGAYHFESIWNHTMRVVDGVDSLELKLAALFHDIGKMSTRTETETSIHYYGHAEVSAMVARSVMQRLKFSNSMINAVVTLVESHMKVNDYSSDWSIGSVRKLYLKLGTQFENAIRLARSDMDAHTEEVRDTSRFDELLSRADGLDTQKFTSPITGNELMAYFNRQAGPWIKEIKNKLEQAVIDGQIKQDDKVSAWKLVESLTF